MRRFALAAASACILVHAGAAWAAAPTFETIDNPGDPTFNQLLSIEDNGLIAGYFGSGAVGHPNQAYLIAAPYTTFQPANVTGSVQTQVTGLNNKTFVGFWSGTNMGVNQNGQPQDANYGFINLALPSGKREVIMVQGCGNGVPATAQVLGINTSLNAAGFCVDTNGTSHAFVYNVGTAVYTAIEIAGAKQSAATSINIGNLVSGFFVDAHQITHAFLAPLTGGTPITFSVPGAQVTQFLGVNNAGEAVGFYQTTPNDITHGLLYDPANGQWHTLDDPNGIGGTVVNGVNNKGQAVGFYTDPAGNVNGMLINNAF
jgi:hypothetical protein